MLYAFGSNGSGQLGVGHTDDLSDPCPTSIRSNATNGRIKQLAAGGNHTIVLFEDGSLKATGTNIDGRCGIRGAANLAEFTDVERPSTSEDRPLKVEQVAATWSATTLLCEDGRLYVCGTGNSGELGLGDTLENAALWSMIPAFPPEGTTISCIASSMAHSVAALCNGEVYGWGKGRKGQLGESREDAWIPRKVPGIDFAAARVVCGRDFTLVVSEACAGQFKVLQSGGNDRFGVRTKAPPNLKGWTGIAASWCSIYAVGSTNNVIAWGRNDHGQLPANGLPPLVAMAAGSEHCLGLTTSGEVLAWGWGEHGNCGSPTDDKGDVKATWNKIKSMVRVSEVFAGCATSFVLTDEGGTG